MASIRSGARSNVTIELLDDLRPLAATGTIELPTNTLPTSLRSYEFDEAGARLTCVYVVDSRTFPWISEHLAECALSATMIALIACVLTTRRIVRRPRAARRSHCRRCLHDITPAAGSAMSALCQECGARTTRRPVVGRPLRPWHFAFALLFALCTLLCAAPVFFGLEFAKSGDSPHTWPLASIEKTIPSWPLWRHNFERSWAYRAAIHSFTDDGQPQGEPWIIPLGMLGSITGSGSRIVTMDFASAASTYQVTVHDCATRTSRTIDIGADADGSSQLSLGPADANSALLIQIVDTAIVGGRETRVRRLDFTTGVIDDLASTSVPSADGTTGLSPTYSAPEVSACIGSSATLAWALVAHSIQFAGRASSEDPLGKSLLIVQTADGERRFEFPRTLSLTGTRCSVRIADEFTVVVNERVIVDVRTGQHRVIPLARFEVFVTDDPHVAALREHLFWVPPAVTSPHDETEAAPKTIALLDLRPQTAGGMSPFPLTREAGAFSPRSGLCALEFAGATPDAPAVLKVWRAKPKE